MDTNREKILRIKQIVKGGMLDDRDNLSDTAKDEVVEFITANADRLRELSLRMVLKIADLRGGFPANWQAMARTTCMRRA
jgi:hypothetical protein